MCVTWEKGTELPSFKQNKDLVTLWDKRERPGSLATFARANREYGRQLIQANDAKNCMFSAYKTALELVGHPGYFLEQSVATFIDRSKRSFEVNLLDGFTWSIFKALLREIILEKKELEVNFNVIRTNLHNKR
jgi:hypothetical protein